MLHEVLGSVVSGRPIWREALQKCQEEFEHKNKTLLIMHRNVQDFIAWGSRIQARSSS